MRRFLDVWWRVLFIFALGNGVLAILAMLLWFGAGIDYWSGLVEAVSHSWLIVIVGCSAIALAIYDGQFIGDIKPSHWSNERRHR